MLDWATNLTTGQLAIIGLMIFAAVMAFSDKIAGVFRWATKPDPDAPPAPPAPPTSLDALQAIHTLGQWSDIIGSPEFEKGLDLCRRHFLCDEGETDGA